MRVDQLRELFGLDASEELYGDYSCAHTKPRWGAQFLHGQLYVFSSCMVFHANLIAVVKAVRICFKVVKVIRKRNFMRMPNTIALERLDGRQDVFTSFVFTSRQRAYDTMVERWMAVNPSAAAAYLGSQQALSPCSAAEDTEYEEADVTRVGAAQPGGQPHPPFPRPLQELLMPVTAAAAAAAGEGTGGVPEGVELKQVAACELPGDTHSLAEVLLGDTSGFLPYAIAQQGNELVSITPWQVVPGQCVLARTFRYRYSTNGQWGRVSSIVIQQQHLRLYEDGRLTLDTTQSMPDLPMNVGKAVNVIIRWELTPSSSSSNRGSVAQVGTAAAGSTSYAAAATDADVVAAGGAARGGSWSGDQGSSFTLQLPLINASPTAAAATGGTVDGDSCIGTPNSTTPGACRTPTGLQSRQQQQIEGAFDALHSASAFAQHASETPLQELSLRLCDVTLEHPSAVREGFMGLRADTPPPPAAAAVPAAGSNASILQRPGGQLQQELHAASCPDFNPHSRIGSSSNSNSGGAGGGRTPGTSEASQQQQQQHPNHRAHSVPLGDEDHLLGGGRGSSSSSSQPHNHHHNNNHNSSSSSRSQVVLAGIKDSFMDSFSALKSHLKKGPSGPSSTSSASNIRAGSASSAADDALHSVDEHTAAAAAAGGGSQVLQRPGSFDLHQQGREGVEITPRCLSYSGGSQTRDQAAAAGSLQRQLEPVRLPEQQPASAAAGGAEEGPVLAQLMTANAATGPAEATSSSSQTNKPSGSSSTSTHKGQHHNSGNSSSSAAGVGALLASPKAAAAALFRVSWVGSSSSGSSSRISSSSDKDVRDERAEPTTRQQEQSPYDAVVAAATAAASPVDKDAALPANISIGDCIENPPPAAAAAPAGPPETPQGAPTSGAAPKAAAAAGAGRAAPSSSSGVVQWHVHVGLHWVGSHIAWRKISADTLKATTSSQEDLLARAVRWVEAPEERLPLAVVMPQAARPAAGARRLGHGHRRSGSAGSAGRLHPGGRGPLSLSPASASGARLQPKHSTGQQASWISGQEQQEQGAQWGVRSTAAAQVLLGWVAAAAGVAGGVCKGVGAAVVRQGMGVVGGAVLMVCVGHLVLMYRVVCLLSALNEKLGAVQAVRL